MKMNIIALRNLSIFSLMILSFIACDRDFASVESDIINENASNFDVSSTEYEVITHNRLLDPIQSNNLPLNFLGVFNDPIYGPSTSSIVAQVNTSTLNPTFGENVALDSVVLTIPYFSSAIETIEQTTTYELDSVYGNSPITLSIYENKFFLRDFDPNAENVTTLQKYYSNGSNGSTNIPQNLLEGTLINRIEEFTPSAEQVVLVDKDTLATRFSPRLRVLLDTVYWKNKIIDKEGDPVLSNTNNFNDYFRGIYFKAEAIDNNGNLSLLNLGITDSNITLYYSRDSGLNNDERVSASLALNFSGNTVNLLTPLEYPIPAPDVINGDEKLYLKGQQGNMAVVNLFGGEDLDSDPGMNEFEAFKNEFVFTDENGKFLRSKRLINEANLVFYVDQSMVDGNEPERIYLYDLKNNIPLVDYINDFSSTDALNSKSGHLGRLEREGDDPNGKGVRYKIRITDHINSILLRDSTNVNLGLTVSANVNLESDFTPLMVLGDSEDQGVSVSSMLTPRSTVLYGNNTADESKKVYLEIYYTEPELNN